MLNKYSMIMKNVFAVGFACLFCVSTQLSAQTSFEEKLTLADKQFELYAYNLAIKSYNEALREQPNNAHAIAQLGRCYLQIGQPTKAIEYFEKAVALPNLDDQLPFQFGQALMMTADYAKAKVWFNVYKEHNARVGQHFFDVANWALANQNTQSDYEVKSELLNTPHADFLPAWYGDRVVFGSTRTDIVRKNKTGQEESWAGGANPQLFVSEFDAKSGYLQRPSLLRGELQSSYNEGPVSFSADGRRVAFCRNNFINGNRHLAESGVNLSLYTADVVGGAWMNIRAFPHNGSDFGTGFPCFSSDGNTLYFASNRPGSGLGGWDIYSSEWNGTTWSAPNNLGSDINTPGNEITPYLDGNQFYFASDWHAGFGGLDVFVCNLDRGSFTGLKNMGKPINSCTDDYGFVYRAKHSKGYFTSSRTGGKGLEDIYSVSRKMADYLLTVTNMEGKAIAGAQIDLTACGKSIYATSVDGKFRFLRSTHDANCIATISHPDYLPMQFELTGKATELLLKLSAPAKPVVASAPNPVRTEPEAPKPTTTVTTAPETVTATSELKPVVHSAPTSGKTSVQESPAKATFTVSTLETETFDGWAVQLVALPDNADEKYLTAYNHLSQSGNVYVKNVDGKKRIRVGVYATEAQARKEAEQLRKQYKSAFVVEEKNMDKALSFKPEAIEKPKKKEDTSQPVMASTPPKQVAKPAPETTKVEPSKPTITARGVEHEELIIMRYAVQLAAFRNDGDAINMSNFMSISDLGRVYTVPEKEFTRVRLGVWEDPAKAESAKNEVVKRGFKEAVVVNEKSTRLTDKLIIKDVPVTVSEKVAEKPAEHNSTAKTTMKSVPTTSTPKSVPAEVKTADYAVKKVTPNYMIRVASHLDINSFDDMYITGIQAVKDVRKSGKYHVVYLTGFDSLEDAVAARKLLEKRGLKDAYLVKEEGNKISRVQL